MNVYNNTDIDNAIKDVFERFPELKYNEEIHYAIYTEVVLAMKGRNITSPYSYAKTIVENNVKEELMNIIKANHN